MSYNRNKIECVLCQVTGNTWLFSGSLQHRHLELYSGMANSSILEGRFFNKPDHVVGDCYVSHA